MEEKIVNITDEINYQPIDKIINCLKQYQQDLTAKGYKGITLVHERVYGYYSDNNSYQIVIYGTRPETSEEAANRIKKAEQDLAVDKARKKQLYEQLKKEFES